MYDQGKYGFPIQPADPGKPMAQAMGEAITRQSDHEQWHCDHPGEWNCPPELSNPADYEYIDKGLDLTGGMTIRPGDALLRGGK